LDVHLLCDIPNLAERMDSLNVACRSVELSQDVDLGHVAAACEGMTYADLNALVYSAQLSAAAAAAAHHEPQVSINHHEPQVSINGRVSQPVAARDFDVALKTTPLSLPLQVSNPGIRC
jgi:SpoVK/Ycf46/Vps4 family AAA+-type ATPase